MGSRLNGLELMQQQAERFRIRLVGPKCVYCGMLANSDDHFPPRSAFRAGFILPACRECNFLAGTSYPTDFWKRVNLVKEKIKKRNRKLVNMPFWSKEDLNELGPNMRRDVEIWQRKKRIVHSRLAWNVESYLASIDKNNAFVRSLAA